MCVNAFHNFNGVVVEKYDVTRPDRPHEVAAEYGNQGLDFKGVPREGFGWVNASIALALGIIDAHQRRALENLTPWETYRKATEAMAIHDDDNGGLGDIEHLRLHRTKTGLAHEAVPEGDPKHSKSLGQLAHSMAQGVRAHKSG